MVSLRPARVDDAECIALLHADSWRRHYRGAYADSFLDGDVVADRRAVWSARLAAASHSLTVVAEDGSALVGFGHVVFDDDERWGSLLDNLHVVHERRHAGIGTALMTHAADAVALTLENREPFAARVLHRLPACRSVQGDAHAIGVRAHDPGAARRHRAARAIE